MHIHNKNSNIQGSSPNVVYHKELLLNERICSLWEQILFFTRSSIWKGKEANEVIQQFSFEVRNFSSFWLRHCNIKIILLGQKKQFKC